MARYDGPIIDAHQHFWEPEMGRQPWLRPEAQIPFRYGSYEAIKRPYLPPDLLADAEGFKIVGTVTMETEWDLDDPVGEMVYTQEMADRYGLPNGAVAHAVLADPNVEATIEQLAAMPIVRSVRNKPGQAPSPHLAWKHPSLLVNPQWQAGFALLENYGLTFDLQVAWWHMEEAAALTKAHPGQTIIINHAALPADRSPDMMREWASMIRLMASLPNVVIKISGIGLPGVQWTASGNRDVVDEIGFAFGAERIMFASNFPVDSLCATYGEVFGSFVELTAGWSESEQFAAFCGTAINVYRLDPALAHAERASVAPGY